MTINPYFEAHPIYNALKHQVIVGLIQLMTDEGLISVEERNGYYITFLDFHDKAQGIYHSMNEETKMELIKYLRYKAYLDYRSIWEG